MEPIVQAKHTSRVLINEARARRLSSGHGFWHFFRMAQSARLRAAAGVAPILTAPVLPAGVQLELFHVSS